MTWLGLGLGSGLGLGLGLGLVHPHGQPEADHLERRARRRVLVEQVLGLEVAVEDALLVQEAHRAEHVHHREGGLALAQPLARDHVEELASGARLHNEAPAISRLYLPYPSPISRLTLALTPASRCTRTARLPPDQGEGEGSGEGEGKGEGEGEGQGEAYA